MAGRRARPPGGTGRSRVLPSPRRGPGPARRGPATAGRVRHPPTRPGGSRPRSRASQPRPTRRAGRSERKRRTTRLRAGGSTRSTRSGVPSSAPGPSTSSPAGAAALRPTGWSSRRLARHSAKSARKTISDVPAFMSTCHWWQPGPGTHVYPPASRQPSGSTHASEAPPFHSIRSSGV